MEVGSFLSAMNPYLSPALLQINLWEMIKTSQPVPITVMALLAFFSLLSWTIIFSKWSAFRNAAAANRQFLRAFRKSNSLEQVALASEQFRTSPLVAVFDFGYEEIARQRKSPRGRLVNPVALERSMQLGISEEMAKLERNMSWLATTATVSPFIGLFGTVWGIIDAFHGLGTAGAATLRAVAPGISEALITTAAGLFAAIPAVIAYNIFTQDIRQFGSRMDDFGMELMNAVERAPVASPAPQQPVEHR
jgi:biopolymer transport protein TolQ